MIGPIGKDYLLSSIQCRWGNVGFAVIIKEVTIFFNASIRIEIYHTGTTVFVLTFHYK